MKALKKIQDRLSFKISLLSISLFLSIAGMIAPALPLMYGAFPNESHASVELLATVPNFGIIVGLLLNHWVIKYIGPKMTVIIGLLISLITGVMPMFITNYSLIFISRCLLGFGLGIFNSLAISLVPYFYKYDENELAKMVGYQTVMAAAGIVASSFLVSYLVTINWHAAFAIFLLFLPALIMFAIFVPLKRKDYFAKINQQKAKSAKHVKGSIHFNATVYIIAFIFLVAMIFYTPLSVNLPRFLVETKMGNSSIAGIISGISGILIIPFGASFGYLFKHLHDKIFPLGYTVAALGFIIIASAIKLPVLIIGIVILSAGWSYCSPYLYNWLDWAAPEDSLNAATTFILITTNIGTFLSPVVVNNISGVLFKGTARGIMIISATVFILLAGYAYVHYFRIHKKSLATK